MKSLSCWNSTSRKAATMLVLGGGRYPLYYPGNGEVAKQSGFELRLLDIPGGATARGIGGFSDMQPMIFARHEGSRLMTEQLYPQNKRYESLVQIVDEDGNKVGDAVALVQPGGDFGDGTVIYVAAGMAQYPDREGLLDHVLRVTQTSTAE